MRSLRLFLLVLLATAPLHAQGSGKDKEPVKKDKAVAEPPKKEKTPAEAKKEKSLAEPPKAPLTLDQLKLSPEALLIIVDDMKEVLSLVPKMVMIRPDKLASMEERIKALEKLLGQDRKAAGVCKLSGRLDGDIVVLRGEFLFSTEQPRARVFLGLQGAFLTDEGDLDRAAAQLEAVEDGYIVKVEKPGNHQLSVNLAAPVGLRRAGISGGSPERSVELGLPGAAVTTLSLELPPGVKELRWNDVPEKRKGARWELALGKTKGLALTWKEPVALPGTGPFLTVDAQITGKIEETQVIWNADLTLEDLRGQAKEWRLAFPAGARAEIKVAGGPGAELQAVEGKPYTHLLKLAEPGTERWVVHVEAIQPRPAPGARLAVGPFQAFDAQRQQGAITLQTGPEALRGQRLVYHRFGETYQREPPKGATNLAFFQYWNAAGKGKGLVRSPLELEWKIERGRAETSVEHDVRLRILPDDAFLEVTSRFAVSVRQRGVDRLDLQLPSESPAPGAAWTLLPGPAFPAALDWMGLWTEWVGKSSAKPMEFTLEGEGDALEWVPPDAQGRASVRFLKEADKPPVVVLHGRYRIGKAPGRLRLVLPKALGTVERETKTAVRADETVELLRGKAGFEEPGPEPHRISESRDGALSELEVAWRPYRPAVEVAGVADVEIFEHTAHVVLRLQIPAALRAGLPIGGDVPLDVPASVNNPKRQWVKDDIYRVSYDMELSGEGERRLDLVFPWPRGATRREVKVRVWAEGGTILTLDRADAESRLWSERGGEVVEEKDAFPSLVLFGAGADPRLRLRVRGVETAPMLADRALIHVRIEEDGSQDYRARFHVSKFLVRRLRIELPQAASACLKSATLNGAALSWEADPRNFNVANISVEPGLINGAALLELKYLVTPEGASPWRPLLRPPVWIGDVHFTRIRWQIDLAGAGLAIPWGPELRAESRLGLTGWLLGPTPALNNAELDAWLTGQNSMEPPAPVSLVLDQRRLEPAALLLMARPLWLLLCSGAVLLLGLVLLLTHAPRFLAWLCAGLVVLGLFALAWLYPALLGYLFYGAQPGLVAFILLCGVQWLIRQNYRRQMVFLPGFSRLKAGSSLTKAPVTREPSTIDAPASVAAKPSSVQGTGSVST